MTPSPSKSGMGAALSNRKSWSEKLRDRMMNFVSNVFNGSSHRLTRCLLFAAVLQIIMSLAISICSILLDETVSKVRDLTFGVVSMFSGWVGISGAKRADRGVLMLYFVMLLWGIGWVASNMTDHMQEKSKQEDICKHALSNELAIEGMQSCSSKELLLTMKLVLVTLSTIAQTFSCWVSVRLSEKLQDDKTEDASAQDATAQDKFKRARPKSRDVPKGMTMSRRVARRTSVIDIS